MHARFRIGADLDVCRLGFGAMHLCGPGLWGEPEDPDEARRVLRRLPDLGIDLIDTADSYGPGVSERLIGEELGARSDIVVATKAGFVRPTANDYSVCGDPDYLRRMAEASRERLGVERIALWQLHRVDPDVPARMQFAAIAKLIEDGVIRHAGLSHVSIEQIELARTYFPVATVQNRYNMIDRASEAVLDHCAAHGIGFMPFYPLAAGRLTRAGTVLGPITAAHGATASQVALAWLLQRSPVMLPIPGTSRVANLEENAGALLLRLTEAEFALLDAKGREAWAAAKP
ncbi:MAG TPA: aldo/keto reductase [Caulobacteraceae bacterium]|jgi:aryl-alcohol dehydrogenase-like predicted oxidoreductase